MACLMVLTMLMVLMLVQGWSVVNSHRLHMGVHNVDRFLSRDKVVFLFLQLQRKTLRSRLALQTISWYRSDGFCDWNIVSVYRRRWGGQRWRFVCCGGSEEKVLKCGPAEIR
jgi:hypothetical protein